MSKVVLQFKYAAVKSREAMRCSVSHAFSRSERERHTTAETVFDIWTWNVWKCKWTRMSQHGSGWHTLADASVGAQIENAKIETMLAANRTPPGAL